jgi:hypothetical protein
MSLNYFNKLLININECWVIFLNDHKIECKFQVVSWCSCAMDRAHSSIQNTEKARRELLIKASFLLSTQLTHFLNTNRPVKVK